LAHLALVALLYAEAPPPPSSEPWHAEAAAIGIPQVLRAYGIEGEAEVRLSAAIVREARHNGLDPLLIVAVIRKESAFKRCAISREGARGLMQLKPSTGREVAKKTGDALGDRDGLYDPELNVRLGAAYLAELVRRFHGLESALLAWNVGPTAFRQGRFDPSLRQRYQGRVLADFQRLKAHEMALSLQRALSDRIP
jgi:soluble lytic murein transglycosylase